MVLEQSIDAQSSCAYFLGKEVNGNTGRLAVSADRMRSTTASITDTVGQLILLSIYNLQFGSGFPRKNQIGT
jgi:hypothetical protein